MDIKEQQQQTSDSSKEQRNPEPQPNNQTQETEQQQQDQQDQHPQYELATPYANLAHSNTSVVVDPALQSEHAKSSAFQPVPYTQPYSLIMSPPFTIGAVSTPPAASSGIEEQEEPLYVNAKQYHRILKRRAARARLEAENKIQRGRKKYLHESRHKHAMRRPRGPGGRFLTAAEIEQQKKDSENSPQSQVQQQNGSGSDNRNPMLSENGVKQEVRK